MQELLKHFHELSLHPKNAKSLKTLILDLAISGQLTREYRAKVHQDIKEDFCKGEFNIPTGWYWNTFQNVCDFKMGKTPPSKQMQFWEGEIPWVSIADMPKRGIIRTTKKKITDLALINHFKGQKVKKGTLLMSFKLSIGKTAILDMDSCHNEAIISIYPKDFIDQKFLYYFLPLISNWGTQVSAIKGNTLNKSKIQNLKVPIPSLEEQKIIIETVKVLFKEVETLENLTEKRIEFKRDYVTSALNQLVKKNSKKEWQGLKPQFHEFFNEVDNIKKLRETILQLAVQGKLTAKWRLKNPELISGENSAENLMKEIKAEKAQLIKEKKIKKEKALSLITEDEIPFELPEGWVWCRLQDLTQLITKGSSPKWQGVNYVEEGKGILFITSENVGTQRLIFKRRKYVDNKFNEIEPRSILKHNDILMNIVGASIGRTAIFDIDQVANINQAVTIIRLFPELIYHYFLYFFNSKTCIQYMFNNQVDNARANLSMGNISKFKIPLPSIQEQTVIVEKLNFLMDLCNELEKEVETGQKQIEDLMQSVLKEVFEDKTIEELENA